MEVIKDRGTLGFEGLAVGPAASADDVLAMLEFQKKTKGLPLVWATDNGTAYKGKKVAEFLERERIIHLFSRPRIPQDNGASERGMGEWKDETAIGRGFRFHGQREVVPRVMRTWFLLDHRPRASKGYRSAVQLEKCLAKGPELVDREAFYRETCGNIKKAVKGGGTAREKRLATRLAILKTLEKNHLISIVRGGKHHRAQQKSEEDIL
jgi:transposase InsO family protein